MDTEKSHRWSFNKPGANSSQGENQYFLITELFLRLLSVIYLIAFYSISSQITGLAGSQGILPIQNFLDFQLHQLGSEAYILFPGIFWLFPQDTALEYAAYAGVALSLWLIFTRFARRWILILLFVLYASLATAGQTFLNFQWDQLLLECGFLAIFLTPASRIMIFLMRFVLFRLRFMSGISKLAMGDPAWIGLTALSYYFETQPLPHAGAWYFHQLPEWLLIATAAVVLLIEIVVPWMMFMTRRLRFVAAWLTIGLQLMILLSSNHNWFNLLTLALCLFLFDDKAVGRILPMPIKNWLNPNDDSATNSRTVLRPMHLLLALVIIPSGILTIYRLAFDYQFEPRITRVLDYLQQTHVVHTYHVFPTMTTRQIEIKISGSMDGINWKPYEFRYRPGELSQRPQFLVPLHPRLDWMMWFVPMHPRFLDWFDAFLSRLLENAPDAVALLKNNPFPDQPPNYLRVDAWQYQFTNAEEKSQTGDWWKRTYLGPFLPLPGKYRLTAVE